MARKNPLPRSQRRSAAAFPARRKGIRVRRTVAFSCRGVQPPAQAAKHPVPSDWQIKETRRYDE